MAKKLIGNQEHLEKKQYVYDRAGRKKAILVHILGKGDCPRCWQKDSNYYTDGKKVYKRLKIN